MKTILMVAVVMLSGCAVMEPLLVGAAAGAGVRTYQAPVYAPVYCTSQVVGVGYAATTHVICR